MKILTFGTNGCQYLHSRPINHAHLSGNQSLGRTNRTLYSEMTVCIIVWGDGAGLQPANLAPLVKSQREICKIISFSFPSEAW